MVMRHKREGKAKIGPPALRDNGKPNTPHDYDEDAETGCCTVCGWAEVVHEWSPSCDCGKPLPLDDDGEPYECCGACEETREAAELDDYYDTIRELRWAEGE